MTSLEERLYGCFYGLVVGDAAGAPYEFSPQNTFKTTDDLKYEPCEHFSLSPGSWTDDTSMMLCLAQSLVAKKGFDEKDQLERYCMWQSQGYMSVNGSCFDIGNQTARSLSNYRATGCLCSRETSVVHSGNGSLMRLAPIPIYYRGSHEECVELSARSSTTTHSSRLCVDSCRLFGSLLWHVLNYGSVDKPDLLDTKQISTGVGQLDPRVLGTIEAKAKQPSNIEGKGFVLNSLEVAFHSFFNTENYIDGLKLAVSIGGDTDTNGAIYGMLAGAYYGFNGIPKHLIEGLQQQQLLRDVAFSLIGMKVPY